MDSKKINLVIITFAFFMFTISMVSAISVPYNDLALEWKGKYSFENTYSPSDNLEKDVDFIYFYSNLKDGKINQKSADDDYEEIIDIETGEFITGEETGNKTTHWINTDVKIGDRIKFYSGEFIVKSTSDKIYLKDFGSIETIKLSLSDEDIKKMIEKLGNSINNETEYTKTFLEDMRVVETMWYDKNSGLKLKQKEEEFRKISFSYEFLDAYEKESYTSTALSEYELRENNLDNDKDGLTDLEELLDYKTNPLEADSDFDRLNDKEELDLKLDPLNKNTDGDFWIDGKDSNPLSKTQPLIYYILGLILIGGLTGGFFWFKSSSKKKK